MDMMGSKAAKLQNESPCSNKQYSYEGANCLYRNAGLEASSLGLCNLVHMPQRAHIAKGGAHALSILANSQWQKILGLLCDVRE